jgi:hypothetical protein
MEAIFLSSLTESMGAGGAEKLPRDFATVIWPEKPELLGPVQGGLDFIWTRISLISHRIIWMQAIISTSQLIFFTYVFLFSSRQP